MGETRLDDIVDVLYDGGAAALSELTKIVGLKRLAAEPYEFVGWTKCGAGCGYYDHCWQQAEANDDVSLVMEVDQGLARELNAAGVKSATQLLASFDVQRLSGFTRP
jgi:predicted RecB family nuclease